MMNVFQLECLVLVHQRDSNDSIILGCDYMSESVNARASGSGGEVINNDRYRLTLNVTIGKKYQLSIRPVLYLLYLSH